MIKWSRFLVTNTPNDVTRTVHCINYGRFHHDGLVTTQDTRALLSIIFFSPFCVRKYQKERWEIWRASNEKREERIDAEGERTAFDAGPETGRRAWANFHMRDAASSWPHGDLAQSPLKLVKKKDRKHKASPPCFFFQTSSSSSEHVHI